MPMFGFRNLLFQKTKVVLPHIILAVFTVVYVIVGSFVFYIIEKPSELAEKHDAIQDINSRQMRYLENLWDLGVEEMASEERWRQNASAGINELIEATLGVFDNTYLTGDELNTPLDKLDTVHSEWTFASALFLSTMVMTTVGYGNLVPKTAVGRIFCIVYAMFGIPLALITIADLGKFVGMAIVKGYTNTRDWITAVDSQFRSKLKRKGPEDKQVLEDQAKDPETGEPRSTGSRMSDVCTDDNDNEKKADAAVGLDDFEFENAELPVPASFILAVLLAYTGIGAIFYAFSESWEFLDSFYFCFITMSTIGFGDMVPADDRSWILLVTIVYIVFGLVLTTMTVDMVGSHYIKKMHYMGRKLEDAKAALAALGGKASNMSELLGELKLMQKKYGLSDADMERIIMNAEAMFTVPPVNTDPALNGVISGLMREYMPDDVSFISWIDRTDDGVSTPSFCGFTRYPPRSKHIGRIPEVHEFK